MRTLPFLLLANLAFAPTMSAQYGLATTFEAGAVEDGNMFDVIAARDLLITGFDLNLAIETATVAVYTVTGGGTFVGQENSAAGWTLETVLPVTSAGQGHPTTLSLPGGILVRAGQTQGLYLTAVDVFGSGMRYTSGRNFGRATAQDASLTILEGIGKSFPFGMTLGTTVLDGPSRIWNGRVRYEIVDEVTTSFTGPNSQDGVMFDVSTTEAITLEELELHLESGIHAIALYTVTAGGTFVGHETTAADWTFLGGTTVTSNGFGVPTPIPLLFDFEMSAGETRGFYVTTFPSGAPGMSYSNGTNFGGVAATDGLLTIHEGVGSAYPFAGIFGSTTPGGSSRVFDGTIRYSIRPLTTPFMEGFTNVPGAGSSVPPPGWLQDLNDATLPTMTSDWLFRSDEPASQNGPVSDHTPGASNFAYVEDSQPGHHATINLLSRPIDRSLLNFFGTPTLSFWVNSNDAPSYQNPLAVDVIEYPLGVVHRDIRPQLGSTMGNWTEYVACLNPYPGPILQIRFRGRNDNGNFNNDVGLDDITVGFPIGIGYLGQSPQFGLATLDINDAGDPVGCLPVSSGRPGPYHAVAHGDGTMDITITSEPARPVLFFAGPKNPSLLDLGPIGRLDVGDPGPTNIVLIADGNGTGFLDSLFRTGSNGDLFVALPTPTALLGFPLGFQVITFNSSPSAISLSNAVEVTFIP